MEKDDLIFIDHIFESIIKIERYVDGLTVHDFVDNDLVKDAVVRNFEIIGEATKHLSPEFRNKYSEIPWKKIGGMRDILIHDYLGIDIYAVWDTIASDLPDLKHKLLVILQKPN
jgi:uncharacterized protein with HEPN domain